MGIPPTLGAPEPGTLIAGKYRVDRVLAAGGMGVIVVAEHKDLGQRVAIKFLLPEAGAQAELVERFLREARAAARLQSDHVVRVFDIGTDERGVPFMVMELLAGVDLGDEIERRGPLPVGEAVGYVVEALDAIVEAHAAGIVHRDLKPSNLFLAVKADGSRRVKVLDFGISKVSPINAAPDAALTSTKSMLGSPGYMSPEQVRSTKTVDVRTDVWALGVILYELLTGAPAFEGETLGDIFAKIREEDLTPIGDRRSDVPKELGAVLAQCLQRDREKRIADAAALRRKLLPFQTGAPARPSSMEETPAPPPRAIVAPSERGADLAGAVTIAAPSTSDPGVEPPRLGSETMATWSGGQAGKRRGRLLVGGAFAVVAAGAAGLWLLGRTPGPDPSARLPGASAAPTAPSGAATAATAATAAVPVTMGETPQSRWGLRPQTPAPAQPLVTPSDPAVPRTAASAAVPAAPASASVSPAAKGPVARVPGSASPAPTSRPSAVPSSAPTTKKKEDLGI